MLLISLVICFLDIAISSVLLCRGTQWNLFQESFIHFSYKEGLVDLWYFSLVRFCFIFGVIIGLLQNFKSGQQTLKKHLWIAFLAMVVLLLYGAAKLLVYSEQSLFLAGGEDMYWFWGLFAWAELACIYPIVLWVQLGSYEKKPATVQVDENSPLLGSPDGKPININGDIHDGKGQSSGDESEKAKEIDEKNFVQLVNSATIGKILRYTKNDFWLIFFGIIFLCGAAIAEVFIPLYTGKVISGKLNL